MSKAAVAAGADGLMIEVHQNPEEAFSDGAQSLLPAEFEALVKDIRKYLKIEGREL
jgi:3-deoxy-7-phosphoheptulonate synthase